MAKDSSQTQDGSDRGRGADKPLQIPRAGWRDVLMRVKDQVRRDNVSIVAAGVAFYGLLAIFPALAAAVSMYGLVADPATVQEQLTNLGGMLPEEAQGVLGQQLQDITTASGGALGLAFAGGLLFALWSAMRGVKAMIVALNIAYEEEERRGFLRYNGVAFLLTLGAILLMLIALSLVVAVPVILEVAGLGDLPGLIASLLRWPILAVAILFALAALYRYGPYRNDARWQWVSWGALAATLLWLVASALFSFYVSNFGNYNETYGSVGAVIVLLMWFYLTAFIVLLGAELNAEMEHQTAKDTTVGEARPMGKRGAQMADSVGDEP